MAVKSVLDIEVNDEAFRRFKALFDQYQAELRRIPGAQKKVTEAVEETADEAEKVVDSTKEAAEAQKNVTINANTYLAVMKGVEKEQRGVVVGSARIGTHWKDIAHAMKDASARLGEMTRNILKWSVVTGALSGLLGAGGLFGISRLAQTAGAGRRSALGLGIGFGEQRAFEVGFGKFTDPDALLSGVAEAQTDPAKRSALIAAGLSPAELHGNSADVSIALLKQVKRLADRTPEEMLGSVFQARQLGQFMSFEDFRRIRNTPENEIDESIGRYRKDRVMLGLTQQQQKAWQDLNIQLNRAGQTIEIALIRGLSPLAPQIARLSDAFSKAIAAFLQNPKVAELLDAFAKSLENFADYIGTPQFAQDVKAFTDGVGKLAEKVVDALRYFGLIPSKEEADPDADKTEAAATRELRRRHLMADPGETAPGQPGWGFTPGKGFHWTPLDPTSMESQKLREIEKVNDLPNGVLDSLWDIESGRGKNMGPSSAGAKGHFQFTDETAKDYNVKNPYDFDQSAKGAGWYMTVLMNKYHDLDKAAAAWNWGPAKLDADIRAHGDQWRNYLPNETRDFLTKLASHMDRTAPQVAAAQPQKPQSPLQITIANNTGGSAVVSSSQLSALPQ